MKPFDEYKQLVVQTAQELTHKGYLMATGGNLVGPHSGPECLCCHALQLRLSQNDAG